MRLLGKKPEARSLDFVEQPVVVYAQGDQGMGRGCGGRSRQERRETSRDKWREGKCERRFAQKHFSPVQLV